MSYYDDASLVLIPSGVKAAKVYSQKPTDGSGDLTFSRASTATRTNASGVIESVASNVPRLDYSGGGTCPSLLLEGQRTNLVFPSDTASTQTRTVTATAHTLTFYGTGTVVLSGVAIATLTGTGANNRVALTFTPTAGSLVLTVSGTVTNWQLEAGAFSSTLIETTTAAVTRLTDSASKTSVSSLIGQTEGTLFVEVNLTTLQGAVARTFIDIVGSTLDRIVLGFTSLASNTIRLRIDVAAVGAIVDFRAVVSSTGTIKVAAAYKTNDCALYVNGVAGTIVANGAISFTTISDLFLGQTIVNTAPIDDGINQALLFPTRLSNSELAELTTL